MNPFYETVYQQALGLLGNPVLANLAAAQASLETGYGKSIPGNNLFGIKSHGKAGGNTLQTTEFVGGLPTTTQASFQGYEEPADSVYDWNSFIHDNPRIRHSGVLSATTPGTAADAMQKAGYATDPQYAAKLRSIMSSQGVDLGTPLTIGILGGGHGQGTPQAGLLPAVASVPAAPPAQAPSAPAPLAPPAQAPSAPAPPGWQDRLTSALESPLMQLGLGILAGNQGRSSHEAFSNAIGGGMQGLGNAQKLQLATQAQALQAARAGQPSLGTSQMQNFRFLVEQGVDPQTAMQRAFSGGVTVNTGTGGPQMGKIPQGYQVVTDPGTGENRMELVPGAPPAPSEITMLTKKQETEQQQKSLDNTLKLADYLVETHPGPKETGPIMGNLVSLPGVNQVVKQYDPAYQKWAAALVQFRQKAIEDYTKVAGARGMDTPAERENFVASLPTGTDSPEIFKQRMEWYKAAKRSGFVNLFDQAPQQPGAAAAPPTVQAPASGQWSLPEGWGVTQ